MSLRRYALVSGASFTLLGLAAFVPALSTRPFRLPRMKLDVSYGLFAGLFPQNVINKAATLAFGVGGLLASRSERASRIYARAVALVMGGAAALGALPATRRFFGFWPLWGNEAILHGANAAVGGYFGFAQRARAAAQEDRPYDLPYRSDDRVETYFA